MRPSSIQNPLPSYGTGSVERLGTSIGKKNKKNNVIIKIASDWVRAEDLLMSKAIPLQTVPPPLPVSLEMNINSNEFLLLTWPSFLYCFDLIETANSGKLKRAKISPVSPDWIASFRNLCQIFSNNLTPNRPVLSYFVCNRR